MIGLENRLRAEYGDMLNRAQVAEILCISVSTLDRLKKSKSVQMCPNFIEIGRQYRCPVEHLVEFMENNQFYKRII